MKEKVIQKNLVIKSGVSQKGNNYIMLAVDVGYRKITLTFKTQDIAEICGMSVAELLKELQGE